MAGTDAAVNGQVIHSTMRSLHCRFSSRGWGRYGGTSGDSPKNAWSMARQSIPGVRTASTRDSDTLMYT